MGAVVGGPAANDSSARPFSRPEEGEKIQWKGRKWEKSLHPLDAMAPLLSFFFGLTLCLRNGKLKDENGLV